MGVRRITFSIIISLLSIAVTASCLGEGDATDNLLFGVALRPNVEDNSCSSKINISTVSIDLVEDGNRDYDGTENASSTGFFAREVCIYLTDAFTGGPVEIPLSVTGPEGKIEFREFTAPTTLSFTGTGSANEQCFIVERINNAIDDPKEDNTIVLGIPTAVDDEGVYTEEDACDITVNVVDDEGPRVRVGSISNPLEEPAPPTYPTGENGVFRVKLENSTNPTLAPTGNVVIPLNDLFDSANSGNNEVRLYYSSSSNPNDCDTAQPISSLTFTPANWDDDQFVCVASQQDDIEDEDITVKIQLQNAQSSDPEYDGLNPRDVVVVNINRDRVGYKWRIVHSGSNGETTGASAGGAITGLAVDDSGRLGTEYSCFDLELRSEPTSPVTVTPQASTTDGTFSPTSLVFNSSNWDQTGNRICVNGAGDGTNEGLRSFDVTFTVSSSDPGYAAAPTPTFRLNSCDNDGGNALAFCTFSGRRAGLSGFSRLRTTEDGGTDSIWIITRDELTTGQSVSVAVSSASDSSETTATTGSPSVTITPSNYNQLGGGSNQLTIAGKDDSPSEFDGNMNYTVSIGTSTGDVIFSGLPTLSLVNVDTDPLYSITKVDGQTEEGVTSNTARVDLELLPPFYESGTVTINVSCSQYLSECGGVSTSASGPWTSSVSLNYTGPGTQTVYAVGYDDNYREPSNATFNVNFSLASGAPEPYEGRPAPSSQSITNIDNETGDMLAIFVTDTDYPGEIGALGPQSADAFCAANRSSVGAPSGTYKAMIVGTGIDSGNGDGDIPDRTASPSFDWVLQPDAYYYLYTGGGSSHKTTGIFRASSTGLIPTTMDRAFASSGVTFWTGMNGNMTEDTTMSGSGDMPNCNGWALETDDRPNPSPSIPLYGQYGQGGTTSRASALSAGESLCSVNRRLICVEQP